MIQWLEWDEAAFARAGRERKPVLLSIAAAWCGACHEMDRTTYADGDVADVIRGRFVAVRVDADRRPDINERYNLGGWPTTAFLTPDGELMTGGTFVPAQRMIAVLERVVRAFEDGVGTSAGLTSGARRPPEAHVEGASEGGLPDGLNEIELLEQTFTSFDEVYGGFGIEPKFPHTAALHLAIALYEETGRDRWRQLVERTLDGMADGGLWDADGGGFCRYSTRRDWQLPQPEKLLESNGSLLRVYADAAAAFALLARLSHEFDFAPFAAGALTAAGRVVHGGPLTAPDLLAARRRAD